MSSSIEANLFLVGDDGRGATHPTDAVALAHLPRVGDYLNVDSGKLRGLRERTGGVCMRVERVLMHCVSLGDWRRQVAAPRTAIDVHVTVVERETLFAPPAQMPPVTLP